MDAETSAWRFSSVASHYCSLSTTWLPVLVSALDCYKLLSVCNHLPCFVVRNWATNQFTLKSLPQKFPLYYHHLWGKCATHMYNDWSSTPHKNLFTLTTLLRSWTTTMERGLLCEFSMKHLASIKVDVNFTVYYIGEFVDQVLKR